MKPHSENSAPPRAPCRADRRRSRPARLRNHPLPERSPGPSPACSRRIPKSMDQLQRQGWPAHQQRRTYRGLRPEPSTVTSRSPPLASTAPHRNTVDSLIEAIRRGTHKPIIVYPNSGEHYDPATKRWHGATLEDSYGKSAKRWYELGASIIGGCCRTSPKDILEIASLFRNSQI